MLWFSRLTGSEMHDVQKSKSKKQSIPLRRTDCIGQTFAIQALVPHADKGVLFTPVAVDANVAQENRRNDFRLLRFLAGPVVRLFLPRRLDREENVGNIVVLACIGATHAHVAQVIVYIGRSA